MPNFRGISTPLKNDRHPDRRQPPDNIAKMGIFCIKDKKDPDARKYGIDFQITELTQPWDAQQAPSGFGVNSLLCGGKLLEDHYISKTRFENILRKEMGE